MISDKGSAIATIAGMGAVILWSMVIGLMRYVTEQFSPLAGVALADMLGALMLLCVVGAPDLRKVPPAYLYGGVLLFLMCEISLGVALGFSHSRSEALEIGVINYLWPGLTILFTLWVNRSYTQYFVYIGVLLATFGAVLVMQGDGQYFSFISCLHHLQNNPLCYGLAFMGALAWAAYSAFTPRYANGQNAVAIFFMAAAIVMWCLYFILPGPALRFNIHNIPVLVMTSAALSFGYALWNIGLLKGNVGIIVPFSYFTPVLSALFSAWWLKAILPWSFWEGVLFVTLGSLLCFISKKSTKANKVSA